MDTLWGRAPTEPGSGIKNEAVTVQNERQRLALAAAAIRQGDRARARELVYAVLDEDPRNATAWSWACEVATTRDERIHCLKQILSINSSHDAARRYLAQLQDEASSASAPANAALPRTTARSTSRQRRHARVGIVDLMVLPLQLIFRLSSTQLFFVFLVLLLVGGAVYLRANTDFLGLAGLDFDTLSISGSCEQIAADDTYWKITYESQSTSEFSGIVRHVSHIRMDRIRILTHDILVTSGDFADPDVVSTSVLGHHFTWRCSSTAHPCGSINLLHTVPVVGQCRHHRP